MAKIQFGPIASDIRGSSGGTVFSRNKGGAYMRARVVGINPQSSKQTTVRANFGANAKAWSSILTASQRAAWTFFAAANPIVNNLGASIQLSGLAMFQRLNRVLAQIGVAMILSPPVDLSVPAMAAITGATATHVTPIIEITTAAQTVVAGAKYYIYATGALNGGRTPAQNQYRFMGAFAGVAAAVVTAFYTAWSAAFGVMASGQTIGVKVATVNTNSGALTPLLQYTVSVT